MPKNHGRDEFDELLLSVYGLLQPSFIRYEAAARLAEPSEDFRRGLAIAIAEFFAWASPPQIAQKRRELERQKRGAAQHSKSARAAARQWANSPEVRKALETEYDKAFTSWLAAQQWQDDLRGHRRPRLRSLETCVRDIAATYTAATGHPPTIVTNAYAPAETGSFADLLREIDKDVQRLIKLIDPRLTRQWSASIVRYAKRLRLTSVKTG